MNRDKVKSKIHKLVDDIKQEFKFSQYYVYEDLDIPEEPLRLSFSGWSTEEGYKDNLILMYFDLEKYIKLVFLQDGLAKKNEVVMWAMSELAFSNYNNYQTETRVPYKISAEEIEEVIANKLPLFLVEKQELHETILANLKQLLSESTKSTKISKIKWLGTQTQLAELFGQLIMKEWVQLPPQLTEFTETLDLVFDLSATITSDNPDVSNNLRKHLQPIDSKGKTKYAVCVKPNAAFGDIIHNKIKVID